VICGVCEHESPGGKRFCADCGASLPASVAAAPRRIERRVITVMFADLVGSTALSTRLDARDFHWTIATCHDVLAASVRGFDGFVARIVGDAVLVLFGYPRPCDDDAARAVLAAQAMHEAIAAPRALPGGFEPRLRIGIATGVAMVGDLFGVGIDVAGEIPNLAARLHSLARPGESIISAATRHLLGDRVATRPRAHVRLKGFPLPFDVFRVAGPARATTDGWPGAAHSRSGLIQARYSAAERQPEPGELYQAPEPSTLGKSVGRLVLRQ
jgi:class 3 adenylate cyclase